MDIFEFGFDLATPTSFADQVVVPITFLKRSRTSPARGVRGGVLTRESASLRMNLDARIELDSGSGIRL